MMRQSITCLTILLICTSCASPKPDSDVMVLDFANTKGAYILAYSADQDVRKAFEDQLVVDLAARDITAWPSYPNIPDATKTTRDAVLAAANAKKAMFVILAEEVPPGKQAVSQGQGRITHDHPDLQEFYEHSKPPGTQYDADKQVFVEVTAYLIQGNRAKSFWSGTTWAFNADGEGSAIKSISTTIADAIVKARKQFLQD